MNYIILNGVNSNTITGLLIQELPPISKPLMRTQIDQIDGRDGDIVTKLGYSTVDKELSIGLHGNYDIDAVIEYFASEGTVVFSNEPDKYYRYQVLDQIDFERLVRFRTATVTMHVQPYKYELNETIIDEVTEFTSESVPYVFRRTANGADIGNSVNEEIVGGSIAWNQLAKSLESGNYIANNATVTYSDEVVTATATVAGTYGFFQPQSYRPSIAGHKYLLSADFTIGTNSSLKFGFVNTPRVTVSTNTKQKIVKITSPETTGNPLLVYQDSGVQIGQSFSVENLMMIDLTQMFGTSVADYIYGLETNHTGDGVAFFRGLFPKPYYAYNAGQLISVTGLTAHRTTGFNQWDEEWEVGGIGGTGANQSANDRIRSKNYIPVVPNSTYYYYLNSTYGLYTWGYDANKNYVGRVPSNGYAVGNNTVTIPSDICYIRIVAQPNYGTTYKHDICINFSGSRNGEYEPYESHSYALDDSLTLRGVPKLVNNKVQFDGDIYSSDGTVQRRYGIVDLGTLTWSITGGRFYTSGISAKAPPLASVIANVVCAKYSTVAQSDAEGDKYVYLSYPSGLLYITDSAYSSASDFKTAMSGVYLVYELATPTTESASPYVNPQYCNKYGTEEFVTEEQGGVAMITGHNSEYFFSPEITITNKGNTDAKPIMIITGSGNIGVFLNENQVFSIALGDTGSITIDAEQMEAYQGGILRNRLVTGDYNNFVLQKGENTISVTGNVTNVEITNYSRWL